MRQEDAEEYTQALGQVVAGGWRQIALGKRLGVPKALGLSVDEWVEKRLGGYVRMSIDERREAVAELAAEGESDKGIADITGVDRKSVKKWRNGGEEIPTERDSGPESVQVESTEAQPSEEIPTPHVEVEPEPLDALGSLAVGEVREKERRKVEARNRKPEPVVDPVPLPEGKYQCIVIDPPWPMDKIERDERPNQGVALDYSVLPVRCESPEIVGGRTITTEFHEENEAEYAPCFQAWFDPDSGYGGHEPCKSIECVVGHAINSSTLEGCHLYLWVTHRFLPSGMQLLDSWGFRYQCVMTWRKNVGITPYSWMYDTEHVLFGRKGSLKLERLGLRLSFEAPVNGHSAKPDVFYDRVREASPGPRLDMFPGVEHDGFEPWGLEASHRADV